MEKLQEKCGIFGVYGKGLDAARLTYFGLFALQHRGQENSGIAASDGKKIRTHKGVGLVPQVYKEAHFKKLKGYIAIGHNRYSTSGGSFSKHSQPVTVHNDIVALAHNGNLPQVKKLVEFLRSKSISTKGMNDSELMYLAIKYYLHKGLSLKDAIRESFPLFTGAFSLLVMTRNEVAAVRDRFGIRPLSIGKLNGGYVIASETCAIDTVNGAFLRDVAPGEAVFIDEKGLTFLQLAAPDQKLDIFEFVYFSRPDSILLGKWVYEVRKNLGRELAKEYPIKADVIVPVPDSAIPAAIGYAETLKIPVDFGLVKNRYIGRTFIMPGQKLRDKAVEMKLHPIRGVLSGKQVVIVDDSIVRGTTAKRLVGMVRNAGAKQVHLLSSCPPIRFPDFYGIDTPSQTELLAANKTIAGVEKFIGADSVCYLSYEGMIQATGLSESVFCTSQFNGYYPIDIGKEKEKISYTFKKGNGIVKRKSLKRLAILISGNGTTAQAVINAYQKNELTGLKPVVISSNKNAKGNERVKNLGAQLFVIDKNDCGTTEEFNDKLCNLMEKLSIDIISLQGWLPLIPFSLVLKYQGKIINQHPGPLDPGRPDFGGKGMLTPYRTNSARLAYVWATGEEAWTESDTHFVTQNFDMGGIIRTEKMSIPSKKEKVSIKMLRENPQDLIQTTHVVQKAFYLVEYQNVIKTLQLFADGDVKEYKRKKQLIPEKNIEILENAKKLAIQLFPNYNL